MLYEVNGKICIATSSYYKEVSISKNGKEFNVEIKSNAEKIERPRNDNYVQLTVEQAYKKNKLSDEENDKKSKL